MEMNSPPPINPVPHPWKPLGPAEFSKAGAEVKVDPVETRPKHKGPENAAKRT
jgi:hypothetical protein